MTADRPLDQTHFETPANERGVWVTYAADWSAFTIYRNETAALRHAVKHGMRVVRCPFGRDPRDVARAEEGTS